MKTSKLQILTLPFVMAKVCYLFNELLVCDVSPEKQPVNRVVGNGTHGNLLYKDKELLWKENCITGYLDDQLPPQLAIFLQSTHHAVRSAAEWLVLKKSRRC